MTPEEEARIRANLALFAEELADLPNFDRILVLLDRFARVLAPQDADALVALIKLVAPDPDDSDPDDDDDDSDEEDGDSDEPGF